MKPTKCPFCGRSVSLVDSLKVYRQSYGLIYLCDAYPVCDARVGCHPNSDRPLGTMANAALRRSRNQAHDAFDPLWKEQGWSRRSAYKWLCGVLAVEPEGCHIGMFSIKQCEATVRAVRALQSSPQRYPQKGIFRVRC